MTQGRRRESSLVTRLRKSVVSARLTPSSLRLTDEQVWETYNRDGKSDALLLLLGHHHVDMLGKLAYRQHISGPTFPLEECESYAILFALGAYASYRPEKVRSDGGSLAGHVYIHVQTGLIKQRERGVEDGFMRLPRNLRILRSYLSGHYDSRPHTRTRAEALLFGGSPSPQKIEVVRGTYAWLLETILSFDAYSEDGDGELLNIPALGEAEETIIDRVAIDCVLQSLSRIEADYCYSIIIEGLSVSAAAKKHKVDARRIKRSIEAVYNQLRES